MARSSSKTKSDSNAPAAGLRWLLVFLFPLGFICYLVYLNVIVVTEFQGKLWTIPARVYARPLELYAGLPITPKQLIDELALLNYQPVSEAPAEPGEYRRGGGYVELISRPFEFWDGAEPSHAVRVNFTFAGVSGLQGLTDQQEVPIVRLDPAYIAGIHAAHGEDRMLVRLKDVPPALIKALLAVEDRHFYEHGGVEMRAIARAVLANFKAGEAVQGGSTLTQQLVKNFFLTPERSLWRKFNEALMAVLLEFHADKDSILEAYLNEIHLGQDGARAIHGFGLASQFYFGKSLQQLSTDQLALLVGLAKGASYFDPRRHPQRALSRRNLVLREMAAAQAISETELQQLTQKPLGVITRPGVRSGSRYPAFIDLVKRQLQRDYREVNLQSEGMQIFTTLDPQLQYMAEEALAAQIAPLESGRNADGGLQGSVVVTSTANGEVLALVGDKKANYPGFNRALDAMRPIGSLVKPAVYLAALQRGDRFTPATMLDDSRLRIEGRDGKVWEPQNYDEEFHGNVLLYEALVNSYNIPTIRLGLEVGLADIARTLKALGVERDVPPYPSLMLGSIEMSPLQVATMYQTLASGGFKTPLRAIRAVMDHEGTPLQYYGMELRRTVDEDSVYLMTDLLHRVTVEGTARRLNHILPYAVAGKTGTSDDMRDSWFVGYSANHLAAVWVGRDDNQDTGLTGASGALKIWSALMTQAPTAGLQLHPDQGVEMLWIDRYSGLRSEQGCDNAVQLPFLKGTGPTAFADCFGREQERRGLWDWLRGIR